MSYIYVNQIDLFGAILKEIERQQRERGEAGALFMDGCPSADDLKPIQVSDAEPTEPRKHKGRVLVPRQLNAAIDAANMIVKEFAIAPRWATPRMGATAWIHCDDQGQSSLYMMGALLPEFSGPCRGRMGTAWARHPSPADYNDLGRCIRMMDAMMDSERRTAEGNFGELAKSSREWEVIVRRWPELVKAFFAKDRAVLTEIFHEITG